MKKKIQNKLGTYLAVTAGVGCAASVAEGAIVVDLSGLSTTAGTRLTIPALDGLVDFEVPLFNAYGALSIVGNTRFHSDGYGVGGNRAFGRGYAGSASAAFPSDPDGYVIWNAYGGTSGTGFAIGENWVAFKESTGKFGWMSFTLSSLGANTTNPISSFGKFVYDPASTSPANAITLQAAVAAAVPEPSSLVLLALGATGLAARRQRKKAA